MNARKLRVESLEERVLLAVAAGGVEQAAVLAAPTEAVTRVVNTLEDPAEWDTADNVVSLREAIDAAADGDTITFASELTGGTVTLSGKQLEVDKAITIDASSVGGITIDAGGESGVITIANRYVGSFDVKLIRLTLTGGYKFRDGYGGGAICNLSAGDLFLENCSIVGNTSELFGGGISNLSGGTVTLVNCDISDNFGGSVGGGGISNWNGNLSLVNCTVTRNSTTGSGGGISNSGSGESNSVSLANCVFLQNTAIQAGGGIYNAAGFVMALTSCSVSGNSVDSVDAVGGGGISNGGAMTISNSVIFGNRVYSYYNYGGGGIYNSGTLTLISDTISGNAANLSGGGLYSVNARDLTLINTIVALNDAENGDDIGYSYESSFSDHNNIVGIDPGFKEAPVFESGRLVNFETLDLSPSAASLAIDRGDNGVVSSGTDAAGNPRIVASRLTEAIVDIGAYEYQERTEAEGLVVTTAADIVDETDHLISLREAVLRANTGDVITFDASLAGGVITLSYGELMINKSISIDASGIGGMTIDAGRGSRGFRISAEGTDLPIELVGLTITGGNAGVGGGICNEAGLLTLISCTVTDNTADRGAGISNSGTTSLIRCAVFGNSSVSEGGGINNDGGASLSLTDSSVSNNTSDGNGGGIFSSGTLALKGSDITNNEAISGGGIRQLGGAGLVTLADCRISENIAYTGGGLQFFSTDGSAAAATLTNCVISRNTVSGIGVGGGIDNTRFELTLINCEVSGNTATEGYFAVGGGIANESGTLNVINCTVSGNSAGRGGGIDNLDTLKLSNCIVALNIAEFGKDISAPGGSITANNIVGIDPGFKEAPVFESGRLVNFETLDLSLIVASRAVNNGDNSAVETETDLAGNPRIVGGIVDIGAYEYQGTEPEQLAAPDISTGNRGVYVSYGANRHRIQWIAIDNASGYELQYSADGSRWMTISVADTAAVVTGLAYGQDVQYRVRALGTGSYTDSEWSEVKTFNVCPMDVSGDGDIGGLDRNILAVSWGAEEGDEDYCYYADVNGDGDVGGVDRNFLGSNWGAEAGDGDLVYPKSLAAADNVFAEFASADFGADLSIF